MMALLLAAMLTGGECEDAQPQLNRVDAAVERADFNDATKLLEPVEHLSFRCAIAIG